MDKLITDQIRSEEEKKKRKDMHYSYQFSNMFKNVVDDIH